MSRTASRTPLALTVRASPGRRPDGLNPGQVPFCLTRSIPSTGAQTPRGRKGLAPSQHAFCLHYLANFNASAAYRAAHPTVTKHTARVEGSRALTHPAIQAFLAQALEARWTVLHMCADEALARVAMDARADPRLLFDDAGKPLPPQAWPVEVANSVEVVEFHDNGALKRVRFASKTAARRTILELTGALRPRVGDVADALADAIRSDHARHVQPTSTRIG